MFLSKKSSLNRSGLAGVAIIAVGLVLTACSSDSSYKRQAEGNEKYLQATPEKALQVPAGLSLPVHNPEYRIPASDVTGATGKQLDIRPPAQPLALVDGSRTIFTGNSASLLLDQNTNTVPWSQISGLVKSLQYPIKQQDDGRETLSTGWIQWERKDENQPYRARYQVSLKSQNHQQILQVNVIALQQGEQKINDPIALQRYSTTMLNNLAFALDKQQTQLNQEKEQQQIGYIYVQSGADEVGLPVLIVRAPFNDVWKRLTDVLAKVGMQVKDASRPQGSMTVNYKPLSGSEWQALGARDPDLPSGSYKLQVGDLDNRSSLQFINPKGHALTQQQNDALVAVFQAALSK